MNDRSGPSWQYDEFQHVGRDYSQAKEAEAYDSRHADFRDVDKENRETLDLLGVQAGDVVADFGAGTGAFAIQAAKRCAKVYAVDVSRAMLDRAAQKAAEAGAGNIEFCCHGFLTFSCAPESVDVITTSLALHHLPDLWKGFALSRMHAMLRPGGRLFIRDVIVEPGHALDNMQAMVDKLAASGGEALGKDMETHFQSEYSTYDWVMDGLLERAGFAIRSKTVQDGVIGTYVCVKPRGDA